MSNVLLWYPRVALEDCKIEGKFELICSQMGELVVKGHEFKYFWIAGYEIKKGWKVNLDATQIHYDPTIYKDPLRFDPSRFDVYIKSLFINLHCVYRNHFIWWEQFDDTLMHICRKYKSHIATFLSD